MDRPDVLVAQGICKSFGETQVLKQARFSLREGEIHALMGENGAGKSTLIKIISGDYTKDAGDIWLNGSPARITDPRDAIARGIRVIHQEINTVKPLTVMENIFLGNFPLKNNRSIDWGKMQEDAKKVLDELGECIPVTEKLRNLTIAEQQIVEIAKALSVRPKVLIMDEPTAALNDQETSKLFKLLRKLRESGVSIVYITHRFAEMYELADRVTVMRDGETVDTLAIEDVTDEKLIKMMVGKDAGALFSRRPTVYGEEVFRVSGLNSGEHLRDINLHINKGELVVLFGLFGAGQTELCRALFGDLPVDSGEMVLGGKQLRIRSVRDACRQGIGYVSDDRKNEGLIPLQSVMENICLPAFAGKLSNRLGFIRREQSKKLAQQYFNKLNVKCAGIGQPIGSLSGGNQQKCVISRWLANDARLMLLNMPTRGVDVGARAEIYHTLEDLADQGVAVLIVSLELSEVLSIADRIYIMHEHRIVAEMKRGEATQEKMLRYALGFESDTRANRCDCTP